MKFLVDMPVTPQAVAYLGAAGHEAIHASSVGLSSASAATWRRSAPLQSASLRLLGTPSLNDAVTDTWTPESREQEQATPLVRCGGGAGRRVRREPNQDPEGPPVHEKAGDVLWWRRIDVATFTEAELPAREASP